MASITLFAAATQATGQQLDDNLTLVSAQAPIPCSVSGTNALTLTVKSNVYTVTAYGNNMQLSGVAASSNNAAMTARLGALPILNVYKDTGSGPVALVGGELIAGNAFTLFYDPTLNSGAGGFHLFSIAGSTGTAINPATLQLGTGSVLTRYLTATASVSFTVFGANSAQEAAIAVPGVLVNDAIQVGPPSMAASVALSFFGYVPASGTVNLRGVNAAGATISLTPGIFRVTAMG